MEAFFKTDFAQKVYHFFQAIFYRFKPKYISSIVLKPNAGLYFSSINRYSVTGNTMTKRRHLALFAT
jgi:hypothetical protein